MVILSSKHKTGERELIVAILKLEEATRGETPFNCCVVNSCPSTEHLQNLRDHPGTSGAARPPPAAIKLKLS